MPTSIRIIGDVHGKYDSYIKLLKDVDYSIQVGDFGFKYSRLDDIDHTRHKIIAGNHDNYDQVGRYPHFLGDYGATEHGGLKFFFVRGELSVDAHFRTEGVDWWRNEQLDEQQCIDCLEAYKNEKPSVVISHGCPAGVLPSFVTNKLKYAPSRTATLLDAMFDAHQPEIWLFGHHHRDLTLDVDGSSRTTTFVCLDELSHIDYAD